jgi:hypothetical protein
MLGQGRARVPTRSAEADGAGCYAITTEIPVTRLASTEPEVAIFAVVPEAGSVPVISGPTDAPLRPVSRILYDLSRQPAGMLARRTWLTK